MSSVLKINKNGKQNVKIVGANGGSISASEDTQEQMQLQLHNAYERGASEGYKKAVAEWEAKYHEQLKIQSETVENFLSQVNEKLQSYDDVFNKLTLELSFIIAEKIVKESIEKKSSINKMLSESMKKVLGANNVIIKINEIDLSNLNNESKSLLNDGSFAKIKFESDDSIEPGGCLIETDIGNVDGRISAQLRELKKQLEHNVLLNDQEDAN